MDNTNEKICGPRMVKGYLDRVTGPGLEELGLSPATAPFLAVIRHNGGISLKGLSDILLVNKAHSTRTVSKLIDDGFVENRAQGREYSLYLTDKGDKASEKAKAILDEAWSSMFKDLTPEEHETLDRIMKKIGKVIREDDQ